MTEFPEGGLPPIHPSNYVPPAKPATGAQQPVVPDPAIEKLAEQSFKLELSKGKIPASEMETVKVHFANQRRGAAEPSTQRLPYQQGGFVPVWPAETRLLYGMPTPIRPEGGPIEPRLLYGAPTPIRPDGGPIQPRLLYGAPTPPEGGPIQPRLLYGAPTPPEGGPIQPRLLYGAPTPPEGIEPRLLYGAPTPFIVTNKQDL